ncbi:hypothetical protein [Helicobacter pylori]|uniref:hypothetical protein n=1 Tax=Helicobacter pylori TaxID=210 RepID=UPI001303FD87|nr:hypothetical protein [Helicobacter pylori]
MAFENTTKHHKKGNSNDNAHAEKNAKNTTKHHKKGNSNDNAHAEKNAKNAPHAL